MTSSHPEHAAPGDAVCEETGVQLVLFDYGQVLSTPPDETAWATMQTIAHLSSERLHEAYWAVRDDYDRGTLNGPQYWNAVARQAHASFNDAQVAALLGADLDLWSQPNAALIAWAARLQASGMRTAVLSNIGDSMAAGLMQRLPWLHHFERCIWSYRLRLAKPDEAIYRQAAAMLGTLPRHILFIDDKQQNVAAARAVGFEAVQFTTADELAGTLGARAGALLWGR